MTTIKLSPKQLLDWMRKTTADMLGYDLSNLTPAQSIRLDRAASLRLELDDLQGKQLGGLPFDAKQYVVVSESLERMFGGDPSSPADAETDEQRRLRWEKETFAGAAEELAQLLGRRHDALERRKESLEAQKEAERHQSGQYLPVARQRAAPPESNDSVDRDDRVST